MALYDGTVQDRYDRKWLRIKDTRKERGFDQRSEERKAREFVDPDTGVSASGATSDYVEEAYSD